jgi:electron transfer flavoprotein alpha subunit
VTVLLLDDRTDLSRQALTLARRFGDVRSIGLDSYRPFAPDALAATIAGIDWTALFAAGTERGNDVVARVAARLRLPLAANCVAATPGDPVAVTRLRWGGSLLEEALLRSARPVVTVAPHAVGPDGGPPPPEIAVDGADPGQTAVQVTEHVPASGGGVSLAAARVIVSGGRGVGSREGFAAIEELAGLLGAAVGCSRAVTSAGWRPHSDQVGQTGTKVAPDVYIACGISGATQHMAGLKGAKRVVAINSDPQAPLMLNADYTVTGDLKEIVPAISAEIRRRR